jgi:hypothetical protein
MGLTDMAWSTGRSWSAVSVVLWLLQGTYGVVVKSLCGKLLDHDRARSTKRIQAFDSFGVGILEFARGNCSYI